MRRSHPMPNLVRAASCLAAALVFAACTGGSSAPPPSSPVLPASPATTPPEASAMATTSPATAASTAKPSASTGPTSFTSTTYEYSLTLPDGWKVVEASAPWDGTGAPAFAAPEQDKFAGPTAATAAGLAAPTTQDLAGYVRERIAAIFKDHGDTCPPVPEIKDPIEIGGEPGMLLGWDCGILINNAVTVHEGVGYMFGLRDPGIHAASYPGDRAIFMELLKSVRFPD
jgi:hypothetical protein